MKIVWYKDFRKHYKKRILPYQGINSKFKERTRLFIENPKNPILKDHGLTGSMKEYRSFWITGNIRIVYKIIGKKVILYDIGTHPQVY